MNLAEPLANVLAKDTPTHPCKFVGRYYLDPNDFTFKELKLNMPGLAFKQFHCTNFCPRQEDVEKGIVPCENQELCRNSGYFRKEKWMEWATVQCTLT